LDGVPRNAPFVEENHMMQIQTFHQVLKSVAIAGFTMSAFLLPSISFAGPPDELYAKCVNDSNRTQMRDERNFCDDHATGPMMGADYNVGIFRPCNARDEEDICTGSEKPVCVPSTCGDLDPLECGKCTDEFGCPSKYLCSGAPGS
jgi:hypothetical protein